MDLQALKERVHFTTFTETLQRANMNLIGPAFTYYTLLSLIPVLLSLAAIAGLVGVDQNHLQQLLNDMLPSNVNDTVQPILSSMLKGSHVSALSISALVALWSVSRIMAVLRQSFNAIHDVPEKINNMLSRVFGFIWLLLLLVASAALVIVYNLINVFIDQLPFDASWLHWLQDQGWLVILAGLWVVLSFFNWSLPAQKPRWQTTIIASFVEVLLLWILNTGFGFYAQLALKQVSFYQTLGSLIVLMVYLNLIGTLLVLTQVFIVYLEDFYKKSVAL